MAALTARRDVPAPVSFLFFRIQAAILILLMLPFAALQAQVICPLQAVAGSPQTTLAGTRFPVQLQVAQFGATSPMPNPVPITWSVAAGGGPGVYFLQSLTTSYLDNVIWDTSGSNSFSSSVDLVAEATGNGPYIVRASTPSCTSQDAVFTVNVIAPTAPSLNLFQGGNQTAVTGSSFGNDLGVVVNDGSTPISNAKVTYTVVSGPARFAANNLTTFSTFTDAAGHALTTLVANTGVLAATPVVVQVNALNTTSGYSGIQVLPAGSTGTISGTPNTSLLYTAIENSEFANVFTIKAEDAAGLPLENVPVSFALSGTTGASLDDNGTPLGTSYTGQTNASGEVAVSVIAGNPGTFALTASALGSTGITWNLQAIAAGSTSLQIVSGEDQGALVNTAFQEPLVVSLANASSSITESVQFNVVSGSAYFVGNGGNQTQSKTISLSGAEPSGVEVFAGASEGDVVIVANSSSSGSVTFTLQVVESEIEEVFKISGNNQQGPSNAVLGLPLVAGVSFSALNGNSGAPLVFEVISGAATFVESGTTTFSAVPGGGELSAQVNLRLGGTPGAVQVRASFPDMLPTVFSATAIADNGNGLQLIKIAGDGQMATTSLQSAPLRVRLNDNGTAVADRDINWQVISGAATLIETQTKTDSSGESGTSLQIAAQTSSIVVRAVASIDSTTSVSTDFLISASDAQLSFVAGSGQGGAVGSDADQMFVFELRRANGSLLPGQTVSFTASSGATVNPASAVTGDNGRVSVGVRYGIEPGSVQVTARAFDGRVSAVGQASTFIPTLSIFSGDNQSAPAGSNLNEPLTIIISQAPGPSAKGLQGVRVEWSVISGGGTLATASSMTDAGGKSSNSLKLGNAIGGNQVRAAIAAIGDVYFTANATVPSGSVLEIISGNNQDLIPQQPSEPLVVRLRTASGTNLGGFTVRFEPSAGATVAPAEVITSADGRASTLATVTLPGDYTIIASVPSLSSLTPVVFSLGNGIANIPELSGPEGEVARAIDSACPQLAAMSTLSAVQQDLLTRCSELVVNANNDTDNVVDALGEMLADESSAQNNAALASASAQFENLKGRFAALRSGTTQGISLGGLALNTSTGRLPLSFLPSNLLLKAAEDGPDIPADTFSRWGFFATGTIGRGSRNPGQVDPGGDFDNYGLTAGVDYRITNSLILGAALGFNRNDSQLNQNLGELNSRGYSLSAYGTWFNDKNYYADAVLTLGRNSTDIARRINYTLPSLSGGTTTIDQIATGAPDSDQQSLALSVGKDFNRGAWSFGPYLRGTYTKLDFDGYIERMSDPTGPGGGLALEVDDRRLSSMQAVLGGKLSYTMSTSWGVLMPSMQVEYVQEFEDDADGLVTRFAYDPTNSNIIINGDQVDTNFLNIGIGLSGVFANGRSGYLYYEHVAGKDRTSQGSLALGIRIEF